MTVLPYMNFFLYERRFDRHEVLRKWQITLDTARNAGFAGVRASVDTSWLRKEDWLEFMQCEIDFERMFGDAPVLLICSYNTQKFDASDDQDVACRHDLVLTRTHARWEATRNAAHGSKLEKPLLWATPMGEGTAVHEVITDEAGEPSDLKILAVDPGFERITSLRHDDVNGKRVSEAFPELDRGWIESCFRVARTGCPVRFEGHIKRSGRWLD
jgi:hypothetical protein